MPEEKTILKIEQTDLEESTHRPDKRDFEINSIELSYIEELRIDLEDKLRLSEVLDANDRLILNDNKEVSQYYIEELPLRTLGFHPSANAFYVKGIPNITDYHQITGGFDGDTLYFDVNTIKEGESELKLYVTQSIRNNLLKITGKASENITMGLRFLGIDAPEIPKYFVDSFPLEEYETEEKDYEDIKNNKKYVALNSHKDEDKIEFIKIIKGNNEKVWCEIYDKSYEEEGMVEVTYLNSDPSDPRTLEAGFKAQKLVRALIEASYVEENGNQYVHMILDRNSLNKTSEMFPSKYGLGLFDNGPIDMLKRAWEHIIDGHYQRYQHSGFNMWGTDRFGRFLGAPYVKMQNKKTGEFYYINISKYLIAHIPEIKIFPDIYDSPIYTDNTNFSSRIFRLETYDFMGKVLAASVNKIYSKYDDRKEIFTKMTGINPESLRDWTVMIGDTVMVIPPTSIRCITESTSDKFPVMRSKGSIQKGSMKSEKTLELSLYFNGEDGVNGKEYIQKLPPRSDGTYEEETYYMNGLRSLVSQFKFTPYMSIENRYINEVLGIEGVSLDNIHISTLVNYPKCLKAVITLKEFNYRQYMPELPHSFHDDMTYFNAFSTCFNFPLMRWYYQRALKTGDKLRGVSPNSIAYMHTTHGNKTALIPMEFKSSYLDIYLADMEHLDRMLQVKLEKMHRTSAFINLSPTDKFLAKEMSKIYDAIFETLESTEYEKIKEDLFNYLKNNKTSLSKYIKLTSDLTPGSGDIYKLKGVKTGELEHYINRIFEIIKKVKLDSGTIIEFSTNKTKIKESTNIEEAKKITISNTMKISHGQWLINSHQYSSLVSEISKKYNFDNVEDLFKGREIQIDFNIDMVIEGINKGFLAPKESIELTEPGIDLDINDGVKFLAGCKQIMEEIEYQDQINQTIWNEHKEINELLAPELKIEGETQNQEILRMKQSIDIDDLETIRYNLFTAIKDEHKIRITSMAVSYSNTYTKIGTSSSSNYASQYMGGQDAVLEVNIQTSDEAVVATLESLSRLSSDMTKEYRLIMPSSPLKIDCELSKFMGINEVLVENIMTQTVEGHPGLYEVSIRFLSIDRTLRNREALQKIRIDNPFHGRIADTDIQEARVRQFFEIEDSLKEAEVYPDLELPTIKELDQTRFNYTKLSNQTNLTYPEPDFYFVYLNEMTSEVYKKILLDVKSKDETFTLSDDSGGKVEISPTKDDEVIKIESTNSPIRNLLEKTEAMRMAVEQINDRQFKSEEINRLNETELHRPWDISKDIKLYFMEDEEKAKFKKRRLEIERLERLERLSTSRDAVRLENERGGNLGRRRTNYGREIGYILNEDKKMMDVYKSIISSIDDYLSSKPIAGSNEIPILSMNTAHVPMRTYLPLLESYMKNEENSEIINISKLLSTNIDNISNRKDKAYGILNVFFHIAGMIESYTDAKNAPEEYSGKKSDWKAGPNRHKGKMVMGKEFGQYKIRSYKKEEIERITGDKVEAYNYVRENAEELERLERLDRLQISRDSTRLENERGGTLGRRRTRYDIEIYNLMGDFDYDTYLLDPYYRRPETTRDEIREYKRLCMDNIEFAKLALFRNMLLTIKIMMNNLIIPNMEIMVNLDSTISKLKEDMHGNKEEKEKIEAYINFLEDARVENAKGILFTSCLLLATDFDENIFSMLKNKRINELNQLIQMAHNNTMTNISYGEENTDYVFLRKFLLALVGNKVISEIDAIGMSSGDNVIKNNRIVSEQLKYMAAAEDPDIYIKDSFYDMIVNDKRGRMARAFPTFYMVMIDEGKEIGMWKLNDNFYNMSSIYEIQVMKSRKIAADTARIVMSNIFHTFTTEDEDVNLNYRYDYRDVWNSLFNPRATYVKAQAIRLRQQPINRARITQGTRMHIRMGYSSNAASLPIVFNGVIAEVSAGEAVEIIGQGDGIELSHPMNVSSRMDELGNADKNPFAKSLSNFASTGDSPKRIIDTILNFEGGFIRKYIRKFSNGYFAGDHPFGITHFGSHKYNVIFNNGETTQNIFEATAKPKWGDLNLTDSEERMFNLENVPEISSWVYDMTPWDAFNVCKSVSPDFVLGIAPFGFRSTIFHGHPRFYYAYDYMELENGTIIEKRKPFQQYHIATSEMDVISNNITVSSTDVRTNAMGYYTGRSGKSYSVGPLWVDWDIYPEDQKSMSYDTALTISGNWLTRVWKGTGELIGSGWRAITGGDSVSEKETYIKKIAWRATANALKESVYDMYQGEMIMIGSPSLKPHDRIFLHDRYEDMQGSFLVEGCVHNMSALNGFTTTVYPDCIAVVDDRHELAIQAMAGTAALRSVYLSTVLNGAGMLLQIKGSPAFVHALKAIKAPKLVSGFVKGNATLLKAGGAISKYAQGNIIGREVINWLVNKGIMKHTATTVIGMKGSKAFLVAAGVKALPVLVAGGLIMIGVRGAYRAAARWAESLQVLQIFPLQKTRRAMTSGLNGSKGLVYGSPTYDEQGFMKNLYSKWINREEGPIKSIINTLFVSSEMNAIAERYRDTIETRRLSSIDRVKTELEEKEIQRERERINTTSFLKFLVNRRLNISAEEGLRKTGFYYGNKSVRDIEVKSLSAENRLLTIREGLEDLEKILYKDGEETKEFTVFEILHEKTTVEGLNKDNYRVPLTSNQNIATLVNNQYGEEDIPVLSKDAMTVLRNIVDEFYTRRKQEIEILGLTSEEDINYIIIESATVINGESTLASTGYTFRIREEGGEKLEEILHFMIGNAKEIQKENPILDHNEVIRVNVNGNEYTVIVAPIEPLEIE